MRTVVLRARGKLFGGDQPSVAGIVMDAEPSGSFSLFFPPTFASSFISFALKEISSTFAAAATFFTHILFFKLL